jgi:hypothetical protein
VCNPDFKLLVALSAPRSGFLPSFQPPGASGSPPGLKSKKDKKTSTKTPIDICIYIGAWGGIYRVSGSFLVFSGYFWIPSKKWFPRLSLLK